MNGDGKEPPTSITVVDSRAGVRLFAAGPFRGSVSRHDSRSYSWRVWHVIGPVAVAKGRERGLRLAEEACLERLGKVATEDRT